MQLYLVDKGILSDMVNLQHKEIDMKELELLKQNAIELVKHHKRHCCGSECNISVFLVARLLDKAGIELTKEERREFV